MLAELQVREGFPLVAVHPGSAVERPRELAVETIRCLICSSDPLLRDSLGQGAEQAGWSIVSTEDPEQAWSALGQAAFHLAVVDLQGDGGAMRAKLKDLVEELAAHPRRLLMVCGHEADPMQEVWARQLGVWLYVPGLSNDVSAEDVQGVCMQAREVIVRWHPALASSGI